MRVRLVASTFSVLLVNIFETFVANISQSLMIIK